eukprot:1159772-Pelagomonas_calceolata.AAC.3
MANDMLLLNSMRFLHTVQVCKRAVHAGALRARHWLHQWRVWHGCGRCLHGWAHHSGHAGQIHRLGGGTAMPAKGNAMPAKGGHCNACEGSAMPTTGGHCNTF